MSMVTRPATGGKETPVRDLGWLLAHRNEVTYITLSLRADGTGRMYVHNGNVWLYQTTFQNHGIMLAFVLRPTWIGITLRVLDFTDSACAAHDPNVVGDAAHLALITQHSS